MKLFAGHVHGSNRETRTALTARERPVRPVNCSSLCRSALVTNRVVEIEDPTGELKPGIEMVERAAGEGDLAALVSALDHALPQVRTAAARALGEAGGDKARFALQALARNRYGERPEVRIAAMEALGNIFDADGYASFLEGFIVIENKKVIAAARGMLERIDPSGFPRRLVRAGCVDKAAISAYGRTAEAAAVPLLASFLEERAAEGDITAAGYWGKVYAAVRALGNIGGPPAVRALERLLGRLTGPEAEPEGFLRKERLEKIEEAAREALTRAGG